MFTPFTTHRYKITINLIISLEGNHYSVIGQGGRLKACIRMWAVNTVIRRTVRCGPDRPVLIV